MEVRILGPVEILHQGRPVAIGGSRQQALIALLALNAPRPISSDRLIDQLWGERSPHSALHAVHVYVSGVRRAFRDAGAGEDLVRTSGASYALNVSPDHVDALRFERVVCDAGRCARTERRRARSVLEDALSLWRGAPFDGTEFAGATVEADRLEELRLAATESLIEIRIADGEHAQLVVTLRSLVAQHPLRERFRLQLMTALYLSGRQPDALSVYQEGRVALDRIGLVPGREMRELEQAILCHTDLPREPSAPPPATLRGQPEMRPGSEIGGSPFVGRAAEMARLEALLDDPVAERRPGLVVIRGDPGMGKTRLLREFAAWAADRGRLVPLTSAEDDDVLPYRPFSELIRAIIGSDPGRGYLDALGSLASDLALLVPELASSPAPMSTDPGLTRTRLFEGVVGLVGLALSEQRLVILIDDAQSMGRGTATLVRALLSSCDPDRLSIVLAARRSDHRHGPAGFHEVLRHFDAPTIDLPALDEADVSAWLESTSGERGAPVAGGDTPADVHARTGGVPLLVEAALIGVSDADPSGTEQIRIDQVVSERRALLTPRADDVLKLAAVSGVQIDPHVIAEVSGLDVESVERDLEEIVSARGLLLAGTAAHGYVWYHELVRDAVLGSIPGSTVAGWRQGLSSTLAERGLALRSARHALAALHGHTRAALQEVLRGVDQAVGLLAFETGEDLCRRALVAAGSELDVDLEVALLGRLGLCLSLSGRRDAADESWRAAARRARQARRSDLLAEVALATEPVARAFTPSPLRLELLDEAIAHEGLEPAIEIELMCAWLEEAALPHKRAADAEMTSKAVLAADRHGGLRLRLRALRAAHIYARAVQRVDRDASSRLCELADHLGDPEWQAYAQQRALIDALIMLDRRATDHHLERYLRAADSGPSPRMRWNALFLRSTLALLRSEVESARTQALAAAELGRSYGMADADLVLAVQSLFAAYHTDALADFAGLLADHAASRPELAAFNAAAGLAVAAAGDLTAAVAIRDQVLASVEVPGLDETWPTAACLTAELCSRTGASADRCAPLRAALERYPGRLAVLAGVAAECGPVQRYVGLLTAMTDPAAGVAHLSAARSTCEQFGATVWLRHIDRDLTTLSGMIDTVAR